MKKILFATLALAAFAACNTDEVLSLPEGPAIEFDQAFVENATKAATDLSKANLNDFGVYGSVENQSGLGMIFDNIKVTKSGDAYTYSPAQYWVGGATYNFVSFAPYTNARWSYETTDAKNGTLTFDNEDAAGEQDLLFASAERTTPASITAAPGAVALTFNHMLSRVKFTFTNGFAEGSNIALKVTDVTITNAHKVGELEVSTGSAAATWTVADNGDESNVFARVFGDLNNTLAENGGDGSTAHYYLIPAEASYIVTFNIELFQAGVSVDRYARQAVVELDMEKGTSYNVKAILNEKNTSDDGELYPIEFTVNTVEEWIDWSDVNAETSQVVSTPAEFAAAVAEGGAVQLANDLTLPAEGLTVAKETSLDLNGKTLTVLESNFVNESTLTVSNGTISGADTQVGRRAIVNKGALTMTDVTVKQIYAAGGSAINNDGANAVAVLNNVTVAAENMAISNKNGAAMTINGGNFVGNSKGQSYAVVNQLGSTLTINGGYFEGGHGVVSTTDASITTLNAGTYHCTATYTGNSDWVLHSVGASKTYYKASGCTFTHANGNDSRLFCTIDEDGVAGEIIEL